MRHVANRACIRRLSFRAFRANGTRNLIAILAILLTTVLFTSLFTIAMSINNSFEQSNFRQIGGFSHGGFKYLTEEQYNELKEDPLIKEYGLRRFLGMPFDAPFNKSHVEIGYSDANQAHWMYCDPVEGRLPAEGTDEAATDTRTLALLGVEPKLGTPFTVTFDVDGKQTTQTFTLCGWWEYDEAIVANHILIPESRVDTVLDELHITPPGKDGMTGAYNLDVMFDNAVNISEKMDTVLANHGYQDRSRIEEGYISTGVNWGYTATSLFSEMDTGTILSILCILVLILFTGYLIIYNVFQISVTNDIRFYGLLKTIGTTSRQIRRIVRQQALLLSIFGIPLGLIVGYGVGALLTPVVISRLDGIPHIATSPSPVIFILSALFALLTVLLSCRKPGRIAGRVSPIEAVRYTEGSSKRTRERRTRGAKIAQMAWANLGRNRKKTVLTVTSLALAVVLLTLTVIFTSGFDMDKYISRNMISDFVVAEASYFQTGGGFSADTALPQSVVDTVNAQGGIADGGVVYGRTTSVQEFVSEDWFRTSKSHYADQEELNAMLSVRERSEGGTILDDAQIYGMDDYTRDHLNVLEGDLSTLDQPGTRNIAAVYSTDDYDNPVMDSHWAKIGDTVTLRYVEEFEFYDPSTGEVLDPENIPDDQPYRTRAIKYRDIDYTVTALVDVPYPLSYRYYGSDEFILNDQTFIQDSGTSSIMLYAFDMQDEAAVQNMETFLADTTQNELSSYDFESKATYAAEFEDFRNMFLMLGGVLSFIVGLVGVLNFFNAVLTGIITRKREFAVLQSIGMTGHQLKTMLMIEGSLYTLSAILVTFALNLIFSPLLEHGMNQIFWFFSYHFTVTPILIMFPIFLLLGVLIPLVTYHATNKQSIVDRIREND
ncbi:ABC transporter permease [Butyricicoccus pullicaecorum]|uniref:ABC transporter permease n=1 Tax=Butyricicoccus pullicaecorum TaxID=501571 RepID=A0A1Y4LQQ2_9FIRM|nr:ABC transporter permease [Butyricicoccus pullicaecorum]OUP58995.1 ABC transporter permease [Butyricicoccus pullicaecorum]